MEAVRVLLAFREREKLDTVIQVHDRVVLVFVLGLRHSEPRIHHGVGVCSAELHRSAFQESAPLVAFGGVMYFSIFLRKIRSKKSCVRKTSKRGVYAQQQQQHRSLVAIPYTPNTIQERSEHLIVGKQEGEGCVISSE